METSGSSVVAVLAEKPSVARDMARILGANRSGDGYLEGNGYVVTWAVGHLVALAQPHEIKPEWRRWSRDLLPMLPEHWPLVVYDKTRAQFEVVRKILTARRVARVICATDAGREGELIFRYIYEAADCEKPVERLWISSLTPEAIRAGFEKLRPEQEYRPLADAARGRSRADWLVGMNLSRAYSLAYNEELSVGRVQTPTLAMVVERELAIRNFVPENYLEVVAAFHPAGHPEGALYSGTWFRAPAENETRLPFDGVEANAIVERARSGEATIESLASENQRTHPPLLYDLTELQRHANRLFGFSAQKTLDTAQTLYERHKLISYPRTDSRHLSQDVSKTLPQIVHAIRAPYGEQLAPGTGERPLGKRFVDDAKVSDHHAIIPTPARPDRAGLSAEERKIYDLICRRLLSAWHDDYIVAVTTVITKIGKGDIVDRYRSSGAAVVQVGWKALDVGGASESEEILPSGLEEGQRQEVRDVQAMRRKTRAPKRFTEATLLTAMETAGKTLEEKELSDAMKECGLGTPATRAAIIEVLLKRSYIARNGKNLEATEKGIRLIEIVHPEVKSPAMTGQWEAYLQRIQRGKAQLKPFLSGIEDYVREVVGKVEPAPHAQKTSLTAEAVREPVAIDKCGTLQELLQSAFGFSAFRTNQEAVCQAAVEGKDVLLVMPTGSGKSLCYQLPAIARGGTTLVISPLIALMEDQVAKLKERGFAVERIHSGRDRAASRQVCLDYLAGRLQFLFIAPERLRVPGFPETLARRKPSLIAIDEAHCISQWGHDFRPDYRMLGQHMPALRPAPIIALTATATPPVQRDIVEQLKLSAPAKFVHGFRRENIAIEIVETLPSQRMGLARELLLDAARRPAIIYTPTRRQAEELAAELNGGCRAAAYHAGQDSARRSKVQKEFLEGRLDVIVATIAFGMGIDKPDIRTIIHTALPGSLEGYYQEIGRAGRDGAPSRAILMHSYADRHTHDFFFERDYPEVSVLESIVGALTAEPIHKDVLRKRLRMEAEMFDKALEKLWTHAGVLVDAEENVTRGDGDWRPAYAAQSEHKAHQIDLMLRYAATNQCRMSALVRHFGDLADGRTSCGICDFCAPAECAAQRFRVPTALERAAALRVVSALQPNIQKSTGRLYTELVPEADLSRDAFEEILGGLARAGLLEHSDAVFEKDGKRIPYRTVKLTAAGRNASDAAALEFLIKQSREAEAKPRRKKKGAGRRRANQAAETGTKIDIAEAARLETALRAWRLAEAKRRGLPAFRIFTDRVLKNLIANRPRTENELLAVPGIGPSTARQYGSHIFRIVGAQPV